MAITYFGATTEANENPGWLIVDRLYWNNPAVVEYTCPGTGNQLVRALEARLYPDSPRPDMHIKVMVYTAAGALVCTAPGLVVAALGQGWKGVADDPTAISPANTTLVGGTKYILAWVGDNANLMPRGSRALANAANYQADSYTSPSTTLPAALGTHHLELSIRCGVEPAPDPAPTITSLDVVLGTTAGGTAVDITGTGFTATPGVTFGGTAATSVVRVSATHVTCVTPAHAVGAVDVVLTNPDTQAATKTNGYTYATPPTITSLDVVTGTAAGGTAVDITGTAFVATPTVTFGGTAATSVVRVSATHVTCVTPAHAVGAVNVVLTNPDTLAVTKANGFEYVPAEVPFPKADTYRKLHQSIG
jgi:hypothetical protein